MEVKRLHGRSTEFHLLSMEAFVCPLPVRVLSWVGLSQEDPWAGAEGPSSGPAIVFMSYKTLSRSLPHPSQASAMSSVKCQGWRICGTPGFPYTAVPLAGIANQLLPSFPAAFFSDLGFFPGLWAGSSNL